MKIVILGNGGHSKVIQDIIACYPDHEIIAILDDKYDFISKINGIIYAPLFYINEMTNWDIKIVIAIGDNATRRMLVKQINVDTDKYITIAHPTAVISPSAVIGNGTVVMPHALVNAGAMIGNHCIINTGAIVEHDNVIGHYTHLCPNATLTGNVAIGDGVQIGASATVIPGINVGHWSVIGAGSTVIKDIPAHRKVVGSPTRFIDEETGTENNTNKVVVLYEE